MMIYCLIGSAGLVAITVLLGSKGTSQAYRSAAGGAFIGTILSLMCMGQLVLLANSLAIWVTAVLFAIHPRRTRVFLASALFVTILVYAIVLSWDAAYLLEARRLRGEYPLESLSERLAYEQRTQGTKRPSGGGKTPELEKLEDELFSYKARGRARALAEVHASYVEQFVNAPGFGYGRITPPDRSRIPLPPARSIPLPPRAYADPSKLDPGEPQPVPAIEESGTDSMSVASSVRKFHRGSYLDFVNAQGFGYMRDLDHVAGFQSHRFDRVPLFTPFRPQQVWLLRQLDLISLLKHPEPVAYVSADLPRMDELRHAPTRDLDVFEHKALAALQRGEDIEVASNREQIRMVGSLRAAEQCLRCHHVEHGDLLGALSYRLQAVEHP